MADTDTATLEDAVVALQANATAEGRCPQCGRRHDDDNDLLFKNLRDELATARAEHGDAVKELQAAQDSNALYEAEVASLRQKLQEAG